MRFALGIEYDGANFHGWQFQPGLRTIQTELEKALSKVADEPIQVICAGRTDAGVHALGQVVHFDTQAVRDDRAWVLGVNMNLPNDIAVTWVKKVSLEFHARFSAVSRTYSYFIHQTSYRSPITSHRMIWYRKPLNIELMQKAAQFLIGEHDFSSFRAADCQAKSPMRHVTTITISAENSVVKINITANAFLHHMVRNIVGVLLLIGCGRKPPEWMKEVLDSKDRCAADITVPPEGLYLAGVNYPDVFKMLSQSDLKIIA